MSVPEFSHILDLVAESLSNTDLSPKDLASLCDFSITLLGQAPQGKFSLNLWLALWHLILRLQVH